MYNSFKIQILINLSKINQFHRPNGTKVELHTNEDRS
jgi:hypothetical protein